MAARRTDARDNMIRSAVRLFQRKGYVGTTMLQVVKDAGAARGSIYFHFRKGKDELAVEVLRRSRSDALNLVRRCAARGTDAAQMVSLVVDTLGERLRDSGFVEGCPVATTALQMAPANEPIRAACAEYFADWQESLALRFSGAGMAKDRAGALACLVVATAEGALIVARTGLSTKALDIASEELSMLVSASLPLRQGRRPTGSEAA